MRKVIWYNTFKKSMGEHFSHALNEHERNIFFMLWGSFKLTYIIKSSFFESIRLGDEKYELWVHKDNNGVITVKFMVL